MFTLSLCSPCHFLVSAPRHQCCISYSLELPALIILPALRVPWLPFPIFSRGAIVTVFVISYALTSIVGGYVSGGFYARNSGE